jgi:hypothetical protein
MGDSDGTYDFTLIPEFIELLKAGNQFVNGSRVKGKMDAGAIPFLHRYLGVPLLTWTLNLLSGAKFSDAHCGMRGFTREAAMRMGLNSSGMEFASEMILQATRSELRTAEIPIPYRLRKGESKLRTFADGWRHIRFMLLHCPTPLFVVPGAALSIVGMIVMLALVGGRLDIGSFSFDIHYMVVGSILSILGFQIVSLGISARLYALSIGILKRDDLISWGLRFLKLERGLMIGSIVAGAGFGILFGILVQWLVWGFNNSGGMMGASILGMTLFVIGIQIIFGSFFNSLLSMRFPRDGNSNN